MTKRPAEPLDKVLSPYLYQCWYLQFPDETAATVAAAQNRDSDTLRAGVEQLDDLITHGQSSPDGESDLARECLRLGLYFDPTSVGLSYVEWLTRVRSIFLEELSTRTSG